MRAEVTFEDARGVGNFLKSFRDPRNPSVESTEEIVLGSPNLEFNFPDLNFSREVDISSLVPPESNNLLTKKLLGNAAIKYRIHLPTPAANHDAKQVSADGKTLEWEFPVATMMDGPVEMNLTAPLPRLSLYLTLAGVVLLLLAIAFLAFLKLRSRPPSTQL
ncbi:hypothetical protein [Roseibacillus persicicus]|uniref:hypothetical protein n=1 Tax=Roseibacillus persicicus TaxID=454148 RepID=UPI00280E51F8|nr:hypothetical protein [Roseibacillus persicicus]MDQ8189492.1 hypothetical protein [Roseibacillus persicicus]